MLGCQAPRAPLLKKAVSAGNARDPRKRVSRGDTNHGCLKIRSCIQMSPAPLDKIPTALEGLGGLWHAEGWMRHFS